VLLATGADAHKTDPLSGLQFDYPGYAYAAKQIAKIANKYSNGRVLIGGAGGYQPYTHTPKIWAEVVKTVYSGVTEKTTDPADQLTAAQIF
jgi:acetoin utilization deacetylase AcuC-like enzyme